MYGQSDEMDIMVQQSKAGAVFDFYGVNDTRFMLGSMLGKKVYKAIEDESDGYRSYLGTIEDGSGELFVYPGRSFAKVRVAVIENRFQDGYALIDAEDEHIWLTIGTDNIDDYYPSFMFNYTPKAPKEGGNG